MLIAREMGEVNAQAQFILSMAVDGVSLKQDKFEMKKAIYFKPFAHKKVKHFKDISMLNKALPHMYMIPCQHRRVQ